jgi:hypothetical protein
VLLEVVIWNCSHIEKKGSACLRRLYPELLAICCGPGETKDLNNHCLCEYIRMQCPSKQQAWQHMLLLFSSKLISANFEHLFYDLHMNGVA